MGIFAPLADIVISKLPSPASLASTTQNNYIEYKLTIIQHNIIFKVKNILIIPVNWNVFPT